jgi:DNA-cytosine methyltransferase
MNVLSLFDGLSAARIALDRAGIKVDRYFASEIDKYAVKIALKNCPDTIPLGDVRMVNPYLLPKIDLLVGGSPCQDLSVAGQMKGIAGERSSLFFDYVRLLRVLKPKYFLLENVKRMGRLDRFIITQFMGVEPIMINSALVSAQQRERLYWTNIPNVKQPADKQIYLSDIIESGVVDRDKSYCIDANYYKGTNWKHYSSHHLRQVVINIDPIQIGYIDKNQQGRRVYSLDGKAVSLKSEGGGWGAKMGLYLDDNAIRMLTPIECERLQTLPDNYTEGVSDTQRYKMLGNAFTVDVIAHILSFAQF